MVLAGCSVQADNRQEAMKMFASKMTIHEVCVRESECVGLCVRVYAVCMHVW